MVLEEQLRAEIKNSSPRALGGEVVAVAVA
jgi:hypothetical protein